MGSINYNAMSAGPIGSESLTASGRSQELSDQRLMELVATFRSMLRSDSDSTMKMVIGIDRITMTVVIERVGQTALIVYWGRRIDGVEGINLVAISMLLLGLDQQEDEAAVSAVQQKLINIPLHPSTFDAFRKKSRPLLATVYCDGNSFKDELVVQPSSCLAAAFFDQLGQ